MSPLAAIALKLVGIVTVVSSLLDYLVFLIPPEFTNPQWQLAVSTQMVERGIVPLVGIALLLTGFWIDSSIGKSGRSQNLLTDLRFWSCLIASILGILFLLLIVVNITSLRATTQQALTQVDTEATQASSQLEQRVAAELSQTRNRITSVLENEDLLSQAIQSGQLPPELEQFKDDPEGLNQFLQKRADEAKQRIQSEIGTRRQDAEKKVKTQAWKNGIRISMSSLFLGIGYTIIGWIGLRRLLSLAQDS